MAPSLSEGKFIPFTVGSETYQTWYTTTTSPSPTSRRPLVLLHGGPGCSHHYLLALLPLAESHQIPMIFYDQIGNGLSTHLPDVPPSFWTPDLFMDELENLLKHLGVENDFDLLGHSWGGMLASQFAAERQPKGLKHLIISDSPASMALWEKAANVQRSEMPQAIQEILTKHEEAGTTESEEYHGATMEFYKKHTCRMETWPKEVNETFEWLAKDSTVYGTMNGPSEFTVVGSLKTWNIIPKLPQISPTLPTLLLNGRYDTANSQAVMPFFKAIPRAKWVTFEASSHMPQWEEQERYLNIVGEFLSDV